MQGYRCGNRAQGRFWHKRLGLGWAQAETFLDLGQVPIKFY